MSDEIRSLIDGRAYKAIASDWEKFLDGPVWHDLQLFITDRLEFNRDQLELTDEERHYIAQEGAGKYESADVLRGRSREAKMLLFVPQEILKELQEIQSQRKHKGE